MAESRVRVLPVTPARWDAFSRLFEARGSPHYCWCMVYRDPRSHEMSGSEKRAAMQARVAARVPVGVLAFAGSEPVGWCSVAPRDTYPRLERSRTMPRTDAEPTWTVLCFFVRRPHRRTGVPRALLEGAVKYARASGAHAVEGYPFDTAGITSTNRGKSSAFRAAGFAREGRRWVRRFRRPRVRPSAPRRVR